MIFRPLGAYYRIVWVLCLVYGLGLIFIMARGLIEAGQSADGIEILVLLAVVSSLVGLWQGRRWAVVGFAVVAAVAVWAAVLGVGLAKSFGQTPNYLRAWLPAALAWLPVLWAWQIGGSRDQRSPAGPVKQRPPE